MGRDWQKNWVDKMKVWKLKKVASVAEIDGVIYPNKEDYDGNFWGHNFELEFGAFAPRMFIVNAGNLQDALDWAIDYMEKSTPDLLFTPIELDVLKDSMDDYVDGGNHHRTTKFTWDEFHSKEIPPTPKQAEPEAEETPDLKKQMMDYLHTMFTDNGWENEAEVAIYYFANDWHEGQSSELYSILSTSPYTPGANSTLQSEGGMAELMYEELEAKFAPQDAVASKNFAHLKENAEEACESKDHEMGEWEDWAENSEKRMMASSTCTICGKGVYVDTKPDPNGIDIGGEAVALNCEPPDPWETATPEELRREIGI